MSAKFNQYKCTGCGTISNFPLEDDTVTSYCPSCNPAPSKVGDQILNATSKQVSFVRGSVKQNAKTGFMEVTFPEVKKEEAPKVPATPPKP